MQREMGLEAEDSLVMMLKVVFHLEKINTKLYISFSFYPSLHVITAKAEVQGAGF